MSVCRNGGLLVHRPAGEARHRQRQIFFVLMISASMVVISSATIAFLRGEMKAFSWINLATTDGAFLLGTGVALAVAVVSYFLALSIGPGQHRRPVFGIFIVGGAVLGLMFLHEPLTLRKAIGILLAIASIYLIAGHQKPRAGVSKERTKSAHAASASIVTPYRQK